MIDVTPTDDAPVVIETIRSRPRGSSVTRSNVVVRQGDRVLTVIKPQLNETNVSEIADEEDFEYTEPGRAARRPPRGLLPLHSLPPDPVPA